MRKTIFIIWSIIFVACCMFAIHKDITNINEEDIDTVKIDTLYITNTLKLDSLNHTIDSLKYINDSLTKEVYIREFKLNRVKYYTDIAKNNNLAFLRGWIYRVLND